MRMKLKDTIQNLFKSKNFIVLIVALIVILAILIITLSMYRKKDEYGNSGDIVSETIYNSGKYTTAETNVMTDTESSAETFYVYEPSTETAANDSNEAKPKLSDETAAFYINMTPQTLHIHNYVRQFVDATCKEQGYTVHTCSCGSSYIDNYINPNHDYIKFDVCRYCGRPSPEEPFSGLTTWLERNGTLWQMKNDFYYIQYEENGNIYEIRTISRSTAGEYALKKDFSLLNDREELYITVNPDYTCYISYSYEESENNEVNLSFSHGDVALNVADISSSMNFQFTNPVIVAGSNFTSETLSARAKELIIPALQIIQDKLLYPNTGLTMKHFGFTCIN